MSELFRALGRILEFELFRLGTTEVTVSTLLAVVALLVVTVWLSGRTRRLVERGLTRRGGRPAVVGTVSAIVYYALLLTGLGIALGTAGIQLTALFAAGAVFAVGIGFALQSIAQNFVAGVILLIERTIRPGDILQVEGKMVKVVSVGIRASIVETRDGESVIIPNSVLIQTSVTNFTLRDPAVRVRVEVGVTYGSDMRLVKDTLTEVASALNERWGVPNRQPLVVMKGFGDNAVGWEIGVWMDQPFEWRPAVSEITEAIWWAFQTHGITIAFPQVDLHLDPEVNASIRQLAGRAA
jgi:small-conductance mechanosensitive channel